MRYNLFLFDLDDTLLDFKASEKLSFVRTLDELGITSHDTLYEVYQRENALLWKLFEEGKTTKEFLKVERFRKTFALTQVDENPEKASSIYLNMLPETVVLVDHAEELCQWLRTFGEIGIVTNGIAHVQHQRIKNSPLASHISFVAVSEECGFAKPDVRFFDYCATKATIDKSKTIIVGDRLEADIMGAKNWGTHSCWFNPHNKKAEEHCSPTYEISHLSMFRDIASAK